MVRPSEKHEQQGLVDSRHSELVHSVGRIHDYGACQQDRLSAGWVHTAAAQDNTGGDNTLSIHTFCSVLHAPALEMGFPVGCPVPAWRCIFYVQKLMEEMPIIERAIPVADNGWAGLLFMAVILVFSLVQALYGSQYFKKMKLLSLGRTRIVSYDGDMVGWFMVALLWIAAVISMSLTVSMIIGRFSGKVVELYSYMVSLGITVVYISVKFGLMHLMKYVFNFRESVFVDEMKILVVVFGAVVALAGLGLAYMTNFWIGIGISGIALLLGLIIETILLVKNFYRGIGSLFYIFLYLCAAEILPLLVGARWVFLMLN